MSLILTLLAIIVGGGLLLFIGLGLAIVFGIFMVALVIIGIISLIFGQSFSCSGIGSNHHAEKIPQAFNQCLLKEDLEKCRTQFTVWPPEQSQLVSQLAKQVREDLGERIAATARSSEFAQNSINGDTTVTMKEVTDFDQKKAVRESYVIVTDPKDKQLKIKELNWDYTAVQNP